MPNNNKRELLPIVDKSGNVIGSATRAECHSASGDRPLHPVVHLHVFNASGELFLQHRAETKDVQPGRWDTSVGGHVDFGESIHDALKREASEELGLVDINFEWLYTYLFESAIERELVYTFRCVAELSAIKTDPAEISEGRFFSPFEISTRLKTGFFTPNFELEFEKLQNLKK